VTLSNLEKTESPYFQPSPDATQVFDTLGDFKGDPSFGNCETGDSCADSWALRVIESSDIIIYTAGLYSWFNAYDESCINDETCQLSVLDTSYTEGFWLYNLFTKGVEQLVTPEGGIPPLLQSDSNQT
jgi:glucan 1,3-beta-glucosidase